MNTPVAVLLSRKGSVVQTTRSSDTVAEAVRLMNEKKIGSLVVVDDLRVVGIFTERDVLSRVVGADRNPQLTRVSAVMTENVVTIGPEATIGDVMDLFNHRHCRHLPVLADGELLGLISIGDVSRWLTDTHRVEAEQLRQYIAGGYPTS
jgi:CBS domain-containing protein